MQEDGVYSQREQFKQRTKRYALSVIELVDELPKTMAAQVIGRQLLRCSTSVGANYRAACGARSPADFVAKMGIVQEEADESLYWMELLIESNCVPPERVEAIMAEGRQLLAMTIASIKTVRAKNQK